MEAAIKPINAQHAYYHT